LIKIFTIIAVFAVGAMAQVAHDDSRNTKTETKVVKIVSTESTAYRSFTATAYSLRGRMANGQTVHSGAIAADPKILKLGTTVHIEGMGVFVVKDTGGDIKGLRVDIWFPNRSQAIKFGRRTVRLRIISKPSKKIRI
jgi:3D (Asp-Asp-Asp) domain-containing protein